MAFQDNFWNVVTGLALSMGGLVAFMYADLDFKKQDEGPQLSQEQVLDILHELARRLTIQMKHTNEVIQKQVEKYQGKIPSSDVKKYLASQFESTMNSSQQVLCEKKDIDEEDFEIAAEFYESQGDEDVVRAVRMLDDLYTRYGGPTPFSETLTPEKLADVMEDYTNITKEIVKEVLIQFVHEGHQIQDEGDLQQLMMRVHFAIANSVSGEEILSKVGLTAETLQEALERYKEEPVIQRSIKSQELAHQQAVSSVLMGGML